MGLSWPYLGLIRSLWALFGLKMSFFLSNTPKMTHSDEYFHMRSIGASEYHFGEYKHIRMDGLKLYEDCIFWNYWFSSKNFGGPYLSSPTWYRGRSVLKIIVWRSSLLTNIFQPLGKHNKSTRASELSKIENFEKFQILPIWTQKLIFWGAKGRKWM